MCVATKEKYIDPFTDFGFKHIFGNENHKEFLISFLNDLLDIKDKIVSIEYRNLEKLGMNIVDRRAIFDIFCTDEKNNNFIVELQRSRQKYFKDRSLYYTSFPIQEQSKKGDWDYKLKKVYFVAILDFAIDNNWDYDNYITKVQLCDVDRREVFYDKLTYYYIEMPKFKKKEKELKTHLEYWLFILNNLNKVDEVPQIFKEDKLLTEVFDVASFLALPKDEQFAYQQDLKARLDYKNVLDYAIENAKEEGIEQGIEQGENKKAIEIVKKSISQGLDDKTISLITGLSSSFIKTLR
jgi:predicted transposase/invertase (TIGR01784 family)